MSNAVFSGTGGLSTGYPKDDNLQTRMRAVFLTDAAMGAAETLTITHGNDSEMTRRITVIDDGTGQDAGAAVTSITRTSASVTTIVFAAGAAGNVYRIVIEF